MLLRTDDALDAFVGDRFPDVFRGFTGGMTRTRKLNLLLESVDGDVILHALNTLNTTRATRLSSATSAPAHSDTTAEPAELPTPESPAHISEPASVASKPPPKYVLHLSDLHFSDETQVDQWHAQLLLDLRNQMQIRELSAVVISGDITNHATVEQFGFAQNFLHQLCESFHIAKQRLIIVPGNHDVNWTLTDQGQDGFSPYAAFYQQLTGSAYPPSADAQTTLLHLADLKLLVLGSNSAWKIDRANPSRAGLHAGAFGRALGSLLNNEEYQTCNKLAVWHHPPAELTAEAGLDGAVLEQLAQAGFRLILHGHIHRADNARFRYYRQSSVGGLEILTAGTFGAPTHELVSGYPFQYQVLEFRGDILTVHTRKRENVAGGWVADHRWQQAPGQSPLSSYQIALRSQREASSSRTALQPQRRRLGRWLVVSILAALFATCGVYPGVRTGVECQRRQKSELEDFVKQGRRLLLTENRPLEAALWLHLAQAKGSSDPDLPDLLGGALLHVNGMKWFLVGHERPVLSAAYSPDGKRIVTTSSDYSARVWASETGIPRSTLSGHEGESGLRRTARTENKSPQRVKMGPFGFGNQRQDA